MLNDIKISVIDEKQISEDLDLAIRDGLVECFPPDVKCFSKQSWWHSRPQWRVLAQDKKGHIVGHIAIVVRNVLVGHKEATVKVAGIQSVFVCPEMQGTGLSDMIMKRAMQRADEQDIEAGFLFCVSRFEKTYSRMGWRKIDAGILMVNEQGQTVPILGKNIAMIYPLKRNDFPAGDVNLTGRDW